MIRVEHAANPEVLPQVVELIYELVAGNAALERTFAIWISAVLSRRSGGALVLPEVLKQLACASTGQIDTWADRVFEAASLDEVFRVH